MGIPFAIVIVTVGLTMIVRKGKQDNDVPRKQLKYFPVIGIVGCVSVAMVGLRSIQGIRLNGQETFMAYLTAGLLALALIWFSILLVSLRSRKPRKPTKSTAPQPREAQE